MLMEYGPKILKYQMIYVGEVLMNQEKNHLNLLDIMKKSSVDKNIDLNGRRKSCYAL